MELEEPDFLVALTHTESADGRLLELNWCAYNIHTKAVTELSNIFINPSGEELEDIFTSGEVSETTGLTLQDMQAAEELPSAMQKFNKFVYETIILQNSSFSIITNGDTLLTQLLPDECTRLGLKLAPHFSKYHDIMTEFERSHPEAPQNLNVNQMLRHLGLTEVPEKIKAQEECKNIIRIISHIVKSGHKFNTQKDINTEKAKPKIQPPIKQEIIQPIIQQPLLSPPRPLYGKVIIIKGTTNKTEETEIEEFLYGLRIEKILHIVDPYGERTGFILSKMFSDEDAQEALCYDKRKLGNKTITIEEASEELFQIASQNAESMLNGERLFFTKIREKNLQLEAKSKWSYLHNGNYYYGLDDKNDIQNYRQLRVDEQEIMNIFRSSQIKSLPFLTSEQRSRAVKLRGFHQKFKKIDVLEYLRDFEVTKNNLILRQDSIDKTTGEAIVVLKSQEEKERVLKTLSNKMFGGRLIEAIPLINT